MSDELLSRTEASIMAHLRASGEPVREAFLFERVRSDGVDIDGRAFIDVLLRLEVEGHVHVDPVRDDQAHDPEPFQPRYWRIVD